MTGVFDAYAAYYDLLYRDKDYAGEAVYVDTLLRRHVGAQARVLEFGCGTGNHALPLAKAGHDLTGIDLSAEMVARAEVRRDQAGLSASTLRFATGDLRHFRDGHTYDAVLALFHVISYQVRNDDLLQAMATAAAHLRPGGIFVFDCWHGPGVLHDPPSTRVRRIDGDGVHITRLAEPVQHDNACSVDVGYEVIVEQGGQVNRFSEKHRMRYLFPPEVDLLLASAGLRRLALTKWRGDEAPDRSDWNACYIAERPHAPN